MEVKVMNATEKKELKKKLHKITKKVMYHMIKKILK